MALEYVEIPGVNIQWPWSEYILSGKKCVETRTYPIPKKHIGKPLAVIETPGKLKKGEKAKIVGIVVFSSDKRYLTKKDWLGDYDNHLVEEDSEMFSFDPNKKKFGWIIKHFIKFKEPILELPKSRGIVFANNCKVPKSAYSKLINSTV